MQYQLDGHNYKGRPLNSSTIFIEYEKKNQQSKEHMERSRKVIPSGMSRGLLRYDPFPFYVSTGEG